MNSLDHDPQKFEAYWEKIMINLLLLLTEPPKGFEGTEQRPVFDTGEGKFGNGANRSSQRPNTPLFSFSVH